MARRLDVGNGGCEVELLAPEEKGTDSQSEAEDPVDRRVAGVASALEDGDRTGGDLELGQSGRHGVVGRIGCEEVGVVAMVRYVQMYHQF